MTPRDTRLEVDGKLLLPEIRHAAAAALPHAEIEIVPGTGHSLNVEKAEAVNARIVQFLSANYR
jgi:pimeloyl-ACP methyl ester carboxylesterase